MNELDIKIINILINHDTAIRDYVSLYGYELFSEPYQKFVKYLINYYKQYKSVPSMDSFVEFSTKGVNQELEDYILDVWKEAELSEYVTDKREFTFLLKKLEARYNVCLVSEFTSSVNSEDFCEEDIDSINSRLMKVYDKVKSLGKKKAYEVVSLKDCVEDYAATFKSRQENPEKHQGVLSGFSVLDYYLNGIRGGEFWLIAADSGAGKSLFLLDYAINAWMGGNPFPNGFKNLKNTHESNGWLSANDVFFVSLEMSRHEVEDRILSYLCSIDSLNLAKGKITAEEAKKLSLALKFRQLYPYNFDIADVPRGCSCATIHSLYDDVCVKNGRKPKLIIVDYLGIMADSSGDSDADWEKLKNISEQLHELARVLGVGVLSAVQVKTAKPGEGGIGMHRIGRSSMIMHNANLGLQVECREDEDMRSDARIHCIKNRRGPKFIMNNLRKEFMYSRFFDLGLQAGIPNANVGKSGEDLSGMMGAIFGEDGLDDIPQEENNVQD